MQTNTLIEAIKAELSQVEVQLTACLGPSSMCSLEKSNQVTSSMKHLEGQQQEYRGALRALQGSRDQEQLLKFLSAEQAKNENMGSGPVGASRLWQEYLAGSRVALERIQELLHTG